MTQAIINFILNFFSTIGYKEVLILMTVESSFIPFPSEIVIPPAAYRASEGDLSIALVVILGIVGSLIGASINYFLALFLGRPLVYAFAKTKIAKVLLLGPKNIEKSEKYFVKHGKSATFLGRLVPAIRQLISVPAGFAKMNYWQFLSFTFLGSAFWVVLLALLGYFFGQSKDLLNLYFNKIFWVMIVAGFAFLVYLISLSIKRTPSK
jgi:membrane protein DedA with SNARE-associated domain